MLCRGIVLLMLAEVVNPRSGASGVVADRDQDRDIDPRKLFLVGNHALPVGVVARMLNPPVKDRVRRAIDLVEVTIRSPAHVPVVIEFLPALSVVIGRVVSALSVRRIESPR